MPRRSAFRIALVAAAVGGGCLHDTHRLGTLGSASPGRPPAARILVLGDFGLSSVPQRLVAAAIRDEARARPFDLAIQLGDNLYYCGPDPTLPGAGACRFGEDGATVTPGYVPPPDPIFRVTEAPLEGLPARGGGALPVYLALGNHDVGWGGGRCAAPGLSADEASRRRACLEVAHRGPAWAMPARHYVVEHGPVRIVVVDTNVVVADYGGFTLDAEIAFVRAATEGCGTAGRHCFLAGHHPPAAVHGYGRGRPSPYGQRMMRLVAAAEGRAAAFFAGHVHALEHLSLGPLDVFISGSTAMGGYMRMRWRVPGSAVAHFASSAWGFAVLEADREGWRVRFQDWHGDALHCCEAGPQGRCLPAECRPAG